MAYRLQNGEQIRTSVRMREQTPESVHILPTSLLLRLHSRVEQAHYARQKDEMLIRVHTIVKNEMELRDIDHVDSEGFEWEPVSISLPQEALEFDTIVDKFTKFSKKKIQHG